MHAKKWLWLYFGEPGLEYDYNWVKTILFDILLRMDYENKRWISLKDGKKESPIIKKFLSKHGPEGDGAHVQVPTSPGWGEEYQSFQKRTKRGSHADDIKHENHITKVPGPSPHLRRWLGLPHNSFKETKDSISGVVINVQCQAGG